MGKYFSRDIFAVFMLSISLLALQLSFTKFFSVVMWYHFGFLIISTAMLGFSAAGIYLSFKKEKIDKYSLFSLINISVVVTFISYFLLSRVSTLNLNNGETISRIFELSVMIILLIFPFFFLGLTISWVLTKNKEQISVFYGSNLLGSAIGAPVFIYIFNHFYGETGIIICTILMLLSSFALINSKKRFIIWSLLFIFIFPLSFFPLLFPMNPPPDKILGFVEEKKKLILYTDWSSLSKVDIVKEPDTTIYPRVGLWGLSQKFYDQQLPVPERHGIIIDSWAYTNLMKYTEDREKMVFYNYLPTTFAFNLGKKFNSSLHIGAGGGMDLYAAKYYRVPHIDGVEINPVIIDALKTTFSDYSGGVYNNKVKGIRVFLDEGRHFVEQSKRKYDFIQLSGVDTFSSTQAGAFALSENNLYTVEALESYYKNINNNGIISMTRWFAPDGNGTFRYSLRLLNIVKEALAKQGVENKNNIFFFRSNQYTILTIKKGGFTPEEIMQGKEFIHENGFTPIIIPGESVPIQTVLPSLPPSATNTFEKFLYADEETYQKLLADYPYKVFAPTDNKPFFFELRKLSTLFTGSSPVTPLGLFSGQTILFIILGELFILSFFLLLLPLIILSKKHKIKPSISSMLYFSLTGLSFMLIEIVFSQKLVLYLGHPTFSLSVVLFSMLFFSGIGSILSGHIKRHLNLIFIMLPLLILLEALTIPWILEATLHAAFAIRVLISILLILPIATLMGMPFPVWMKTVKKKEVPFLWGINGFFSVIASVLCILLSINFGFNFVLYIALLGYTIVSFMVIRMVK